MTTMRMCRQVGVANTNLTAFARGLAVLAAVGLSGCGSDAPSADPGDGTGALLVDGEIDVEENGAELDVAVERDGQPVTDAVVVIKADDQDIELTHAGDGEYRGASATGSGWYGIEVTAGDDWLDGGIETPPEPQITEPDPDTPFDPHEAEGGAVVVRWDGGSAMSVRVKSEDFEWSGDDTGSLSVPATAFTESSQKFEVRRRNEIALDGGAPGSRLHASHKTEITLLVTNPYED